jgi:type II secretory pathway predicted ATPase ExeA
MFEADGNLRTYWLWTEENGWKHRDHIMEKSAIAQIREQKIKIPELNNKTTPEAVMAHTGKIRKTVRAR